jgi:hypothetical protein
VAGLLAEVDVRRVGVVRQQPVGHHLELADPALPVELDFRVPVAVDATALDRVQVGHDLAVPGLGAFLTRAGGRRRERQSHERFRIIFRGHAIPRSMHREMH